jgi:hypothetical protein
VTSGTEAEAKSTACVNGICSSPRGDPLLIVPLQKMFIGASLTFLRISAYAAFYLLYYESVRNFRITKLLLIRMW